MPFGEQCVAELQTRTCTEDGWADWSGSDTSEACAAAAPRDCQDPPGEHGTAEQRTRYEDAQVPFGQTCVAEMQTRTCWDGTWSDWSGTYTADACVVAEPSSCTDPDTAHGGSDHRTRYATQTVPFGETCQAEDQTRTCWDGTWSDWSGTFTYDNCSTDPPLDCQSPDAPHGGTDTRTRYAAASVPYGATCEAEVQQRTCWNGAWSAWSGTYAYDTCTVPALVSMRIVPGAPVLARGEDLAFTAIATLDDGNEQDITTLVAWSSADPLTIAFTGSPGVATGKARGTTTIAADADGVHADVVAVVRGWTYATVAPYGFAGVDFAGDQQGRDLVAWGAPGSVPGSNVVMTRAWQGGWATSENVATEDDDVSDLRAAINARGDRHVLWKVPNRNANTYYLRASDRLYQATSWSAPSTLSSLATGGRPALALSYAGRALATWDDDSSQQYAGFVPQSGWPAPTALVARRGFDAAVDALGDGIIIGADTWLSPTIGSAIYAYLYDRDTDSLGPRVTVYQTSNTTPPYEAAMQGPVGMDALGNAITVWVDERGMTRTLMSSRYVPGSGWQAPQVILAVGDAQVIMGNLSVQPSGMAAFAFSSNFGGLGQRVFVAVFSPQTGWGAPTPLSTPGINASVLLAGETVATSSDGRALAVWSEPFGSSFALRASRYDPEAGWAPAEHLDSGVDFSDESAFGLGDGFFVGYVADYDTGSYIRSAIFE